MWTIITSSIPVIAIITISVISSSISVVATITVVAATIPVVATTAKCDQATTGVAVGDLAQAGSGMPVGIF